MDHLLHLVRRAIPNVRASSLIFRGYATNSLGHPLKPIFLPSSVAVIGATNRPKTVGRTVLGNLLNSPFGGTVYPVSPSSTNILGVKSYKSIKEVPEQVDLAVIVTPSKIIPGIVQECVDSGVKGAIIISAGFKEVGPEGEKLQDEVLRIAKNKIRIIGPNCLGVINPVRGLNATFASRMALPGNIGFISQSGAFCTAVLDWSFTQKVGFSSFVSVGGMADVDWGDLIYYLGNDPTTKSILMYMESIGNAQSFISAAREVSLVKPIVVIKGGRTEGAASAASSHTGALAGSDDVVDAVFRRCGVLRVNNVEELFYLSDVLCKQPKPKGKRLTIITNAGGPAVFAVDGLLNGKGELAPISDSLKAEITKIVPGWSKNNPVDLEGTSSPRHYVEVFKILAKNRESDGMLLINTPSQYADPADTAELITQAYKGLRTKMNGPLLASWMGGESAKMAEKFLNVAGIPTISYPDLAANIWNFVWQYSVNLSQIYETPKPVQDTQNNENRLKVKSMLEEIRKENRTILTEYEAKQIFEIYGIPTVKTYLAQTDEEAVSVAKKIGFPVVLKLNSKTLTHKTDVGGVKLNLKTEEDVKSAFNEMKSKIKDSDFHGATVQKMANLSAGFELILGSSIDPQMGPVLLFGAGGTMVEVYKDACLGLPPLNTTLALRMIERTKIYKALQGYRGKKSINVDKLCELLVHCSDLVVQHPVIKTFDINPLLASPNEILALDARIILHEPEIPESSFPIPAIRPYPSQYIHEILLNDGSKATVRPILPSDEPLMVDFNNSLSSDSIYIRYFHLVAKSQLVSHEALVRMCFLDFNREIGLVVETGPVEKPVIIALGQLARTKNGLNEAEFSILVSDSYQHQGLGTILLRDIVNIAKNEKIEKVTAEIMLSNTAMKNVAVSCGFTVKEEEGVLHAEIHLPLEI